MYDQFGSIGSLNYAFQDDYQRCVQNNREYLERNLRWAYAEHNRYFHDSLVSFSMLVRRTIVEPVITDCTTVPKKFHSMFSLVRSEMNGFLSGLDWEICMGFKGSDEFNLKFVSAGTAAFAVEDTMFAALRQDIRCLSQ